VSVLAFTNARLVCPVQGEANGALIVRDGAVAAFGGDPPAGATVIDCGGRHLAPAIVDLGVFAVDRPALRAGGIARVGLMPDQSPPLDDPGLVQRASLIGKPDLWIHPLAAATRGLAGRELTEAALCRSAGARALATGAGWIADSGVMARVLLYARDLGLAVVTHAEDGGLAAGAVATAGETATRLGLAAAPPAAEALAAARDLMLAEETGARLHLRQVTTAAALDLVRAAKRRGVGVTCGITPAHLLLNDGAISDFRTFARLSPPLRDEADRRACLDAVADGTIDILCSGHQPQGPEAKRLPFADAEPGMAGAETLLPLALTLVRDGHVTLARLFAMLASAPATVLGVAAGTLEMGAPADLLLFDRDAPWRVSSDAMAASAGNTPFDGLPVQGRVLRLWKGAREV